MLSVGRLLKESCLACHLSIVELESNNSTRSFNKLIVIWHGGNASSLSLMFVGDKSNSKWSVASYKYIKTSI